MNTKTDEYDDDTSDGLVWEVGTDVPPATGSREKEEVADVDENDVVEDDVLDEDDEEIEVVDDTPPEDRDKEPLPKEVVEELEDDTKAEKYSKKVQERLAQLRKAWHDERREKEALQRQTAETTAYTKKILDERNFLREKLSQGEVWALDEAKRRAQLELEQAKRAYRDAYESGESNDIIETQQALSRATYQFDQIAGLKPQYALQAEEKPVYNEPQQPPPPRAPAPDDKTQAWGKRNPWFGKDPELTSFTYGVHQRLVESGVPPASDEYFEQIDARLKEVFPDKFGGTQKPAKRQPNTVVAPTGRAPQSRKVTLRKSQVEVAKRLGISPAQYAREQARLNGEQQ